MRPFSANAPHVVDPGRDTVSLEGKLNPKDVVVRAREAGTFYPINGLWRKLFTFVAVLVALTVVGLPVGVWIFLAARNGGLGITEEGFGFRGLGSAAWRWEAIESFKLSPRADFRVRGGGLVGVAAGLAVSAAVAKRTPGLKGPIHYRVKGSRLWRIIPAHTYENSGEMAREMERRTGLTLLPTE